MCVPGPHAHEDHVIVADAVVEEHLDRAWHLGAVEEEHLVRRRNVGLECGRRKLRVGRVVSAGQGWAGQSRAKGARATARDVRASLTDLVLDQRQQLLELRFQHPPRSVSIHLA